MLIPFRLLFRLFFIMLCVHDSLMTFHYYRNGFRQHYFDSIRNIGKNISPPVIEPLIKMAFTTICGSENRFWVYSRPETLAHSHSLTDTPPIDHLSLPYSSTSFRPSLPHQHSLRAPSLSHCSTTALRSDLPSARGQTPPMALSSMADAAQHRDGPRCHNPGR